MNDRKYRQRGYQDSGARGERPPRSAPAPAEPRGGEPRGRVREPRAPNVPGFRSVVKCTRCGHVLPLEDIGFTSQCSRCGTDLHACVLCESFDTSAAFECTQTIAVRVSPKDVRNTCPLFEPRVTVERETTTPKVQDARSAFDDLFK